MKSMVAPVVGCKNVKCKMSHTADTSAFGRSTVSSNCCFMAALHPGRHSWRLHILTRNSWYPLYRPRRDERLCVPRPGLEPTTTKLGVRPRLGSNPQTRDSKSNALTLTLPGRFDGSYILNHFSPANKKILGSLQNINKIAIQI